MKCCLLFACIVSSGNAGWDMLDYYMMAVLPSLQSKSIGETLWIHQLPQGENKHYISGSLAIGKDGTIYYEAGGGQSNWDPVQIYAVNKSNGSLKWKSEPLMSWGAGTILVGDQGNIYVASYTKLYSLNPSNGSINWVWEVPEHLPGSNGNPVYTYGALGNMVLANNNDIIIKTSGSGSYYRAYYCVSPATGTIKWFQFTPGTNARTSIGKNGMIYDFSSIAGVLSLTSRSSSNGVLNWSMPVTSNPSSGNNIAFADNGDIITLINLHTLARIDSNNHQILWETETDNSAYFKFIAPNGNIYIFSQWSGWSIYDSKTGNIINSSLNISSQPFNYDKRNHIFGTINDYEGIMHVTDNVGNEIWRSKIGVDGSSIVLSDNVVYFHSLYNGEESIFALKTDAGLVHAGWPRFSHDNRNTFNFNKW